MSRLRALLLSSAIIACAIASQADVVKLRQSCPAGENPPVCFDYLDGGLAAVLAEVHVPTGGRSRPSASNPVTVDIGAGAFPLVAPTERMCDGTRMNQLDGAPGTVRNVNLTFRGAGKNATILLGGAYDAYFVGQPGFAYPDLASDEGIGFVDPFVGMGPYGAVIKNCANLTVEDLQLAFVSPSENGVRFVGQGSTTWRRTKIYLESSGFHPWAWLDGGALATGDSVHRWENAEIEVRSSGQQGSGIFPTVSRHEIEGSTFLVDLLNGGGWDVNYGPIYCVGPCDVFVTNSRLIATDHAVWSPQVAAIWVQDLPGTTPSCATSRIEVRGGSIEVDASGSMAEVYGIFTQCAPTPTVIAHGAGFSLQGSNVIKRISTQSFDSPYFVGTDANPPAEIGAGWSAAGADTFVETDCSATRCADTSQGTESHLLTFDPSCTTSGPWYDAVTAACRGL